MQHIILLHTQFLNLQTQNIDSNNREVSVFNYEVGVEFFLIIVSSNVTDAVDPEGYILREGVSEWLKRKKKEIDKKKKKKKEWEWENKMRKRNQNHLTFRSAIQWTLLCNSVNAPFRNSLNTLFRNSVNTPFRNSVNPTPQFSEPRTVIQWTSRSAIQWTPLRNSVNVPFRNSVNPLHNLVNASLRFCLKTPFCNSVNSIPQFSEHPIQRKNEKDQLREVEEKKILLFLGSC